MKPQYWICRARCADGTYHAFRWTSDKHATMDGAVQECYGRGMSEAYEALPIGTRRVTSEKRNRELAASNDGWQTWSFPWRKS